MSSIFVGIASYRDPELRATVDSLAANASGRHKIAVGVFEQDVTPTRPMPPVWIEARWFFVNSAGSRGLCWARATQFSMFEGEDYFLQIDAHTEFEWGWDATLIDQLEALPGFDTLISTYPMPYRIVDGERKTQPHLGTRIMAVKDGQDLKPDDTNLMFVTHPVPGPAREGFAIAGGFLFGRGHFVDAVPYDARLYFRDEQSIAVRAWTRGWSIWHPEVCPVYHHYREHNLSQPTHWEQPGWAARKAAADKRLCDLLYRGADLGVYGLGDRRSLAEFAAFSGIDYPGMKVTPFR